MICEIFFGIIFRGEIKNFKDLFDKIDFRVYNVSVRMIVDFTNNMPAKPLEIKGQRTVGGYK